MSKSTIKAGVCGFTTVVNATTEDMQNVSFEIETDCPKIKNIAANLDTVDAYQELGAGRDSVIMSLTGCCLGCIVPNGISKTMQVTASLMLPAPCSIEIE
ncbi:MAG: hypothetical protein M1335_02765 [Chloroflexi bacterium]|nr:hypothetical protein [Chloroflexota bacterium]MCL5103882.1 hypothetical protein [Armatimonadota bacterium]